MRRARRSFSSLALELPQASSQLEIDPERSAMKTRLEILARLSRPLLVADVVLVGLATFFAISLSRELSHAREVPPPKAHPQQVAAAAATPEPPGASERLDTYNLIAAKHLFSPSRSEAAATQVAAASATPPLVKPLLHGVVVDGDASLAFLEDPGSKRTVAYRIGDAVAGGQLVQIAVDRISIHRADGQLDVTLNDPSKPKAAPVTTGAPAQQGAKSATVNPAPTAQSRTHAPAVRVARQLPAPLGEPPAEAQQLQPADE
jgi:Type II secretion system protein C